jgi:hypothetical protein
MSSPASKHPIALEDLLAYQLRELDEAASEAIEEHLFTCDSCTARLEQIQRLETAVHGAVGRGEVMAGLTVEMLESTEKHGMQIRTYALAPGESVACTVAPDDVFVAMRLRVPASEVDSLPAADLQIETTSLADGAMSAELRRDCTVDRTHGEVVVMLPGDMLRALPRSRVLVTMRRPGQTSGMGEYLFDHTPWERLQR